MSFAGDMSALLKTLGEGVDILAKVSVRERVRSRVRTRVRMRVRERVRLRRRRRHRCTLRPDLSLPLNPNRSARLTVTITEVDSRIVTLNSF